MKYVRTPGFLIDLRRLPDEHRKLFVQAVNEILRPALGRWRAQGGGAVAEGAAHPPDRRELLDDMELRGTRWPSVVPVGRSRRRNGRGVATCRQPRYLRPLRQRGMKQRVMVGIPLARPQKVAGPAQAAVASCISSGPVPARWTRSSALPPQTPPGAIAAGFLAIVMARSAQGSPQITDGDCDYQCADKTTDQHVRQPGLDPGAGIGTGKPADASVPRRLLTSSLFSARSTRSASRVAMTPARHARGWPSGWFGACRAPEMI